MAEIPKKADVVVIGGGPSGSIASGLLSQKGYEVALLEKAKHPRPIVGESILPHFWRYSDMLGDASERIRAAGFVQKAGVIARWDGVLRRMRFRDFGHDNPPMHADREIMDKILLDCSADCGTQVFEQTPVTHVDIEEPGKVTVHYGSSNGEAKGAIAARYVVDASGQSAVVARQQGFRQFDEALRFSALWGYYRGGAYLDYEGGVHPFDSRFRTPPVTFLESIGGWGWTWHIVLRETVSVGVVVPPERLRNFMSGGNSLESKFTGLVAATPGLSKLMQSAEFIPGSVRSIRNYSYKPVKLATQGCYLVGDAAAFVDPINSSGVTFGMYAGFLAAQCIERALERPDKSEWAQKFFEREYRQRLHIFRLVALPPGETNDADMAEICRAFRWFSLPEKQLALTTTLLTNRPGRVQSVLGELGISEGAIYNEIPLPAEFR